MKRVLLLLFLSLFFNIELVTGQCSMVPVDLSTRINNSSAVAEGKVIAKKSFWNQAGNYIYTSNLIEVYNIFKGNLINTKLEVITDGGEIGIQKQLVDPSLELNVGDAGVFTLNNCVNSSQFGFGVYSAYADMQGFIKYDPVDNSATEPFAKYNNIQNDVYGALQALLKIRIRPSVISGSVNKTTPSNLMSIAVFAPTSITAGTATTLTITGNGFGASQGTSIVEFKNADDGGATYVTPHSSQYVSWSNTQIVVQVPTKTSSGTLTTSGTAGTGVIRVTTASGSTVSVQTLTVSYGHLNVFYSNTLTPTQIFNTRHVDLNGLGGVTWQMYTGFDAMAAPKAAFQRAFQSWRCATYINWTLGSTVSTNTIALDGINVIRFDIGSELPAGVLGRCTSYFSGCIVGTVINFYVSELDICFDDATNWQYGPAAPTGPQYDFESVTLHELGHGHQLSHVINNADVMHYSIANAVSKRVLNTDDINGGNAVMTRNLSGGVCGKGTMTALSPTNCAVGSPTAAFTINPSTVCVGQTVSLTDNSAGSPSSWSWTITGGSPSTSTVQNPATTYSSSGVYSITLVSSNGFGSSSPLTKTISVIASPTISVSGNSIICAGQNTTLTASGATSYTWMPGSLTGASQVVSPASTTIYTVTGSNGVCTGTKNYTVTVNPNPTVTVNNATICAGQVATLTASGATTYTWMPGSLTGTVHTFTPASTSVYSITGANGSCTNIKTATITVLANPTVNITASSSVICSGASSTLTASGATTYTWMPGSLTGTSQVLSPASTTAYTITGSNGSCSGIKIYTLTVNPTPTITITSATICSGGSASLTASGATTYTWMPGSFNGSVQTFTPSSTTIYTVTGASGSCSSAKTTTITVNTTPTVSISGTSVICSGKSTTLTATGAVTYTWNPGAYTGSVQTLSPSSTTVYSVTGANGNCISTKNYTVTVNPSPVITVNSATICSGGIATLVATGATTYTWMPGSMSGSLQTLSPASTTIYTITGSNGTCTSTVSTNITVNTTPTISVSGASVICSGNSTALTAGGATSYTWNPGVLTGSAQTVSPLSTTVYTVTGANGNCMSSKNYTVTVNPSPTVSASASSSLICSGQSNTLTANGATTYTWNPGALTGSVIAVSPTTTVVYTVTGSAFGCSGNATVNVAVSPCTGINTVIAGNIKVYPNPTQDIINIEFGSIISCKVSLYNIIGQEIYYKNAREVESLSFDLGPLAKGIYFVRIKTENGLEKVIRVIRD